MWHHVLTTPRHMESKKRNFFFHTQRCPLLQPDRQARLLRIMFTALCPCLWREEGMKTLEDILVHYDKKDVTPFLTALDTMLAFCKEGRRWTCSRRPFQSIVLLSRSCDAPNAFSLFGKKYKDLYRLDKEQIVGGPNLIFHHYHEPGETHFSPLW